MISPLAYIHPEAKIGENVEIAPLADKIFVSASTKPSFSMMFLLYTDSGKK